MSAALAEYRGECDAAATSRLRALLGAELSGSTLAVGAVNWARYPREVVKSFRPSDGICTYYVHGGGYFEVPHGTPDEEIRRRAAELSPQWCAIRQCVSVDLRRTMPSFDERLAAVVRGCHGAIAHKMWAEGFGQSWPLELFALMHGRTL